MIESKLPTSKIDTHMQLPNREKFIGNVRMEDIRPSPGSREPKISILISDVRYAEELLSHYSGGKTYKIPPKSLGRIFIPLREVLLSEWYDPRFSEKRPVDKEQIHSLANTSNQYGSILDVDKIYRLFCQNLTNRTGKEKPILEQTSASAQSRAEAV